jgi:hypothetical protein
MILTLTRTQYLPDCTLGMLEVAGKKFFTLERPWLPHPVGRAGADYASCIAEGSYRLVPWMRPSGEKTFALSNPQLDVYQAPFDIPREKHGIARALILIHAADYVHDVLGGIGPGLGHKREQGGWMVTSSRDAMNQIRTLVAHKFDLTLIIERHQVAAA